MLNMFKETIQFRTFAAANELPNDDTEDFTNRHLVDRKFFIPTNKLLADDKGTLGAVTFLFDGGTLQCTFGTSNRDQMPYVAMIVFPASVDKFSKLNATPID